MKKEVVVALAFAVLIVSLFGVYYRTASLTGLQVKHLNVDEICGDGVDNSGDGVVDEGCAKDPRSVIPQPQEIFYLSDEPIFLDSSWVIAANLSSDGNFTAHYLQDRLNRSNGLFLKIVELSSLPEKGIIIGDLKKSDVSDLSEEFEFNLDRDLSKGYNQGYLFVANGSRILIAGNSSAGRFYGAVTLSWLVDNSSLVFVPNVKIVDWPDLEIRGYYGGMDGHTREEWIENLTWYKMNFYTGSLWQVSPPLTQSKIDSVKAMEKFLRDRQFFTVVTLNPQYTANYDKSLYEGVFVKNVSVTFGEDDIGRVAESGAVDILGDFETDSDSNGLPDGWYSTPGFAGSWARDCTTSASGSCSMKLSLPVQLTGTNTSEHFRTQGKFNLRPDTIYALKGWARKNSSGDGGQTQITTVIENSSGQYVYTASVVFEDNYNEWKNYSVSFSTYNSENKFSVYSRSQSTPALELWIDNVTIEEVSTRLMNVMENERMEPVVYNLERSRIYERDIDYTIEYIGTLNPNDPLRGNQMVLSRLPSGNISAGETVSVDYDFLPRMQASRTEYHTFSDPGLYDIFETYFVSPIFSILTPDYVFFGSPDELRGFNRDSRSINLSLENYELLAKFQNDLINVVKSYNESTKVLTWDDMENPFHNGGNENYQVPYGGKKGKTWYALDLLPRDYGRIAWWYDSKDYTHMVADVPALYEKLGFTYFAGPWDDTVNTEWWAKQAKKHNASGMIDHEFYDRYGGIVSSANYSWNVPEETLVCDPNNLEVCDGIDNDCDAEYWVNGYSVSTWTSNIDESFNLSNDYFNCGSCGNICYYPRGFSSCVSGNCSFEGCYNGFFDANNDLSDGCECSISGEEICDGSDNDCDGEVDEGCVNDQNPDGGNGGSSGGGGTQLRPGLNTTNISGLGGECVSLWSCQDWGRCVDGIRSRVCEDVNSCSDSSSMPNVREECGSFMPEVIIERISTKESKIAIAGIIALSLILIGSSIWLLFFKKIKSLAD